ncbi:hypothetical protein Tco_0846153 [Tanacetum coccineum]
MSTMNQGMSFAEIEQIVAQQVANAIETIAIYEAKTRMALDLMNPVEQQEGKITENASNKRKWEGDHGGSSSQNKGHKVIRVYVVGPSNKKFYAGKLPHYNRCKLHHTGPCSVFHLGKGLSVLENEEVEPEKCLPDESLVIPLDEIHIDDKLHFVEEPIEIMDREVKRLKQIRIPIVKVRWNSRIGLEFMWEREDQF